MLAGAPNTAYIREPFNTGIKIAVINHIFENEWQYICDENGHLFESELANVLRYKYPFFGNVKKISEIMDVIKIVRDQGLFWKHSLTRSIPILKDPIALFTAEWLCELFNMNVLVMIRHPAAFCSSIKIKGWTIDFNHFLRQPLLIEGHLKKYKTEIVEYSHTEKSLVEQAILVWNCFHHTISKYQEKNGNWLFMRHEDLSREPVHHFRSIYETFGLTFTRSSELRIMKSSGPQNPTEQQRGYEFVRNSRENIFNWKKRLTQSEINLIKEETAELSPKFYSEDDW
jgi:hypothetical protein